VRMRWIALVGALAGCAKGSAAGAAKDSALECTAAYGEYDRTWRVAWTSDLAETAFKGTTPLDGKEREALVTEISDSLPTRRELAKLREVHLAGTAGGTETRMWIDAWAAAERAIDACGEGARRPAASR